MASNCFSRKAEVYRMSCITPAIAMGMFQTHFGILTGTKNINSGNRPKSIMPCLPSITPPATADAFQIAKTTAPNKD